MTTSHVAGIAVRNREIVGLAHYYGVAIHTCVVADPESKGGSESSVKLAKADVLPRPDNLVADYETFAQLEAACEAASSRFNTRVHRETNERPIDRLEREREFLHRVPAHPYSVALGQTRVVSWSSLISFEGARYSVPYQLCEEIIYARRAAHEVVITALGPDGPYEAARHAATTTGQITLVDAHYPDRPRSMQRRPKAGNKFEADFLAIGEGAQRYLTEMASVGAQWPLTHGTWGSERPAPSPNLDGSGPHWIRAGYRLARQARAGSAT